VIRSTIRQSVRLSCTLLAGSFLFTGALCRQRCIRKFGFTLLSILFSQDLAVLGTILFAARELAHRHQVRPGRGKAVFSKFAEAHNFAFTGACTMVAGLHARKAPTLAG
jgi:hypothetical protein